MSHEIQTAIRNKKKTATKKSRIRNAILLVLLDFVLAGMILCVFALFHHVIPRKKEPIGIVITYPQIENTTKAPKTTQPATKAPGNQGTWATDIIDISGGDSTENGIGSSDDAPENTKTDQNMTDVSETEQITEEVTEEPTEPRELTWAEKFADHFTDQVVITDHSYSSPNISITINTYTKTNGSKTTLTYYIADIYITDIRSFQTVMAGDEYGCGYHETVLDMSKRKNGLIAMTGDFYGYQNTGCVIRNGVVYRADPTSSDICVLFYNGEVRTYGPNYDLNELISLGAYQAWTFGPKLLDENGHAIDDPNATSYLLKNHPRSALGYIEPGHYCFAVFDGRQTGYSNGIKFTEMANIMESFGCKVAYNLDGGKSSVMTFMSSVFSKPVDGGRAMSDCLIIREVAE